MEQLHSTGTGAGAPTAAPGGYRRAPPPLETPSSSFNPQRNSYRRSLDYRDPSISTVSPFQSPISPNFPEDGGLAPRPPSYPSGGPQDGTHTGRPSSRSHRESSGSQSAANEKPLPPDPPKADPPPEVPDAPRAPPPVSYRGPHRASPALVPPQGYRRPYSARAGSLPGGWDAAGSNNPYAGRAAAANQAGAQQRPRSGSNAGPLNYPHYEQPVPASSSASNDYPTSPPQGATSPLNFPRSSTASPPSRSNTQNGQSPVDQSAQQKRDWAPDRSPLQKLEITLNDISKEEKRARVEEAELVNRESRAGRGGQRAKRRAASGGPPASVDRSLEPRNLAEAGLVRSFSDKQKERLQRSTTVESKKPVLPSNADVGNFSYQEQQYLQDPESYDATGLRGTSAAYGSDPRINNQRYWDPAAYAGRVASGGIPGGGLTTYNRGPGPNGAASYPNPAGAQGPANSRQPLMGNQGGKQDPRGQKGSYNNRSGSSNSEYQPGPRGMTGDNGPPGAGQNRLAKVPRYDLPTQTASGQSARGESETGDGINSEGQSPDDQRQHRRLSTFLRPRARQTKDVEAREYQPSPRLDEWRNASTARLLESDLDLEVKTQEGKKAWWEKGGSGRRRNSTAGTEGPNAVDGADDGTGPTQFNPQLYLRCGPLLRYTGIKTENPSRSASRSRDSAREHEIWRGSVMIVTEDTYSSYSAVPTLRLFAQPMDLLPPPPTQFDGASGQQLAPEYVDPIAGLPKCSRTGKTLFVRPVEDVEGELDFSRLETNEGLYEDRTSPPQPNSSSEYDGTSNPASPRHGQRRVNKKDGERLGKYREVKGTRIHAERGFTFWRFNIEVELGKRETRIGYRINRGPAIGFWVPARGQTMNIMFHSCNGFSLSVNPNDFSGPDPLWRDVLNSHQTRPFHVMIGGGDQIYNDAAMRDTTHFKEWLSIKNPLHKHSAPFAQEMQEELDSFYLERYAMWFSQGLFGLANSQIPMINIWDDHDIIDGYGSYPDHFMRSPVFTGLGAVAFKYYMLFQHQSAVDENQLDEPSWLLGASPGPYIHELSRSRDEVLREDTYRLVFDRLHREIVQGETKHLIVLLGVPIAYPRLNFLENILTSKLMDPVKALGRTGVLGGFLNQFDGGVEILDDLDDHWTAKEHKRERNWFIQELQELAAEKSVRITILGGDVHLAAVGQFYSNPKLGISKDHDNRYMPNIISSAIVNTPPPELMADTLNKRNKVHHLDDETDEDMIPMFTHDVNGKPRNNRHLLPRRNWASLREYYPGTTPPATPRPSTPEIQQEPTPPQPAQQSTGRITRSLSLTRRDFIPTGLFRRNSRSQGPPPSHNANANANVNMGRPMSSLETRRPPSAGTDFYYPPPPASASGSAPVQSPRPSQQPTFTQQQRAQPQPPSSQGQQHQQQYQPAFSQQQGQQEQNTHTSTADPTTSPSLPSQSPFQPQAEQNQRPRTFRRRTTNLSTQAAQRGGAALPPSPNHPNNNPNDEGNHDGEIDLEHGLDITINCELSQRDPAGITTPYRLLVPALWYQGEGDLNVSRLKSRKKTWLERVKSKGSRKGSTKSGAGDGAGGYDDGNLGSENGQGEAQSEGQRYAPGGGQAQDFAQPQQPQVQLQPQLQAQPRFQPPESGSNARAVGGAPLNNNNIIPPTNSPPNHAQPQYQPQYPSPNQNETHLQPQPQSQPQVQFRPQQPTQTQQAQYQNQNQNQNQDQSQGQEIYYDEYGSPILPSTGSGSRRSRSRRRWGSAAAGVAGVGGGIGGSASGGADGVGAAGMGGGGGGGRDGSAGV
ncbi:MAG: hypothetical protein M1819_002544 [Sarea resinae]|nr:MAG: hypothetical protein M1819_002544 [Sarea resinae]